METRDLLPGALSPRQRVLGRRNCLKAPVFHIMNEKDQTLEHTVRSITPTTLELNLLLVFLSKGSPLIIEYQEPASSLFKED